MSEQKRSLLLNFDYTPISFVSDIAAVVLVLKGKVDVVSVWEGSEVRTSSTTFQVPSTMRLKRYVKRPNRQLRFSRRVLFNRDGWTCLYCGRLVTRETASVDHVLPKSMGGKKTWKNCATACKQCNKKKANRTPEQAGMTLTVVLTNPNPYHFWSKIDDGEWHETWRDYFG